MGLNGRGEYFGSGFFVWCCHGSLLYFYSRQKRSDVDLALSVR